MKRWARRLGAILAIVLLVLTVVNASWLAPEPKGGPKLVAHRGVHQLYDHAGVGRDTCTATRIEQPSHPFLENTLPSMQEAVKSTAQMVEVDIAPTADGEIALFHDWSLDCRTDGTGPVREATLAELKALDAGFGYTADGGKTFPFRGTGLGMIPSLGEAAAALPNTPMIYNFKSKNPAEAELLARKLREAGRDPEAMGDGFYGHPAVVARARELFPDSWAFSADEAEACSKAYVLYGWTGILPAACKGGTLVVPLDRQFAFWGWPNRLIARMEAHGGRVLVVGPIGDPDAPRGLTLPEQFGEIPDSFNGYVWVEDIWNLGPALRPSRERRSVEQQLAGQAAVERRRAASN